ncbi:MAG: gamma-glutamyltransferase [Gemmataceae bacterium]|nr:gamma-glutamyltransferase [Gemmataceae bacterium]
MPRARGLLILTGLLILVSPVPSRAEVNSFSKGLVVSVSEKASQAGLEILKQGGNAVDAAIATAFALAVTHPAAGNIGGGGFMVVHPGGANLPTVFEYREAAPLKAHRTVYSPDDGMYSHKVPGVPGTVRGMGLAHQRFGTLPWKDLLQPAIRLAGQGFPVSKELASSLNGLLATSKDFLELQKVFAPPNRNGKWKAGDLLRQNDLARTLERIAQHGPEEFYTGETARLIEQEMIRGKGLISREDLANYQAHERKPIAIPYRGHVVYAPPLPSSGGHTLGLMLNILDGADLKKHGRWSHQTKHLLLETMRRAFLERARHLGDQGFTDIPHFLLEKTFAKSLHASIDDDKATPSKSLAPEIPISPESDNTTHFSVADAKGMAVSNTYTLERSYGSKVVVTGAGFLLNNEMLDFNWFPGTTTNSGRIGSEANTIAPRKKMLSSMTPVIVTKNGQAFLVTGSPGGRTIINTVLQVVINVIDFDMTIQQAVDSPRLHHQWLPDKSKFEDMKGKAYQESLKKLQSMGHEMSGGPQGDAHSILIDPSTRKLIPGLDQRIEGGLAGY